MVRGSAFLHLHDYTPFLSTNNVNAVKVPSVHVEMFTSTETF